MKIFKDIKKWQAFRSSLGTTSLGFVPTMGALHLGHVSLVEQSQKDNDKTLISLFLNPTQFNQAKDLEKYPSDIEADIQLLESRGVDYLLLPTSEQIYPDNFRFQVHESELSQKLCGQHRPGHFIGVLTIVLKFLHLAQAKKAYFGEKDYQQLQLIRQMVEAFFIDTKIISMPTVREQDGLAMSSRNKNLNPEERVQAPFLYEQLCSNKSLFTLHRELEEKNFKIDYLEEFEGRLCVAAHLGSVRLIDNVALT